MTTFDTDRMARGWSLIAEGAMELSLAYSGIEQRPLGTADSGAAGASVAPPLRSAAPDDDLPPPLEDDQPPLKPQVDRGLGKCPVHGKAWVIKPAGVSARTKKPYKAFWKCSEKDGDTFCNEKPQPIWVQTHPPEPVAA